MVVVRVFASGHDGATTNLPWKGAARRRATPRPGGRTQPRFATLLSKDSSQSPPRRGACRVSCFVGANGMKSSDSLETSGILGTAAESDRDKEWVTNKALWPMTELEKLKLRK